MREFDVKVRFNSCESSDEIYTIEANTEKEAEEVTLTMAHDDLSVVEVRDTSIENNKFPKCKHYVLNQIDTNDDEWCLMYDDDLDYLLKVAQQIFPVEAKRLEVVGTNEDPETYLSCYLIFTREL